MPFRFRQIVIVAGIGALLFCISCEKHPLGQMPEVQREQPDPAKSWSKAKEKQADQSSSSPTPAEEVPREAR
jgi:hypothetical protein